MRTLTPFASSVWLIVEKIISIGISLIVTLALARHLMPENFGRLSILLALTSIAAPLMAMGLNSLISREILRRPTDSHVIIGSALALRLFAGLTIAGLATLVAHSYVDDASLLSLLLFASIFNAAVVIDFWFQANLANGYAVVLRTIVLILFALLRLWAIANGSEVTIFVYLAAAEFILTGVFYLLAYFLLNSAVNKFGISICEARELFSKSKWLLFSGVAAVIYLKIDQVMLGLLLNDRAVGIYAAAVRISEVWYFIPSAIVASFFPRLLEIKSADDLYNKEIQRLNDVLFCAALSMAILVSIWSEKLILNLFGVDYLESVDVLVVHIWCSIIVFMRALLSKWLIAGGFFRLSLVSQMSGALVNVLLNIYLIPLYGIIGAAYATVISYSVAGYLVLFVHRDLRPMGNVVTRSLLLPYRILRCGYHRHGL